MLRSTWTTPQRLLLASVAIVVAAAGAGAVGLQGFASRASALEDARAETSHQVRIQIIRTSLEIADTAAGDDILRGPAPQDLASREFDYALQPAVIGMVIAARQDDDAGRLALANRRLAQYAMEVETARRLSTLSRAQAAAALSAASALLRTGVLPRLIAVQDASQVRLAKDERAAVLGGAVALLGLVLALVLFAGVHWWLTLRTRRYLNLGVASGLVLLVLATATGVSLFAGSQHQVSQLRSRPWQVARGLVEARVAAFDARSDEALGVVTGGVADAEPRWQSRMASARSSLLRAASHGTPEVRQQLRASSELLAAYAGVHATLVAAAHSGRQLAVEEIAINPADTGSAGSFAGFDVTTGALLARQTQAADDGWAAAGRRQDFAGWLCLVLGLGAAASGWWGMDGRRREYR